MHNYVLVILGTLRLTRFVTTDWLGHWWIVRPARAWALRAREDYRAADDPDMVWAELDPTYEVGRVRLVKGLDCPFCVGFWIGAVVLASMMIVTRLVPPLLPLWRFALGTLALNYLVGHVSSRIED